MSIRIKQATRASLPGGYLTITVYAPHATAFHPINNERIALRLVDFLFIS